MSKLYAHLGWEDVTVKTYQYPNRLRGVRHPQTAQRPEFLLLEGSVETEDKQRWLQLEIYTVMRAGFNKALDMEWIHE